MTISDDYAVLNARLHRDNLAYGSHGDLYADVVVKLADRLDTRSILDYGCGKSALAASMPFPIAEYDPAVRFKNDPPEPADLVICTDVLEHVEPEHLEAVLTDLKRCVRQMGYFVIHTGASTKALADGRNAHLIQHGKAWWMQQLGRYFQVTRMVLKGSKLHVSVEPKSVGV